MKNAMKHAAMKAMRAKAMKAAMKKAGAMKATKRTDAVSAETPSDPKTVDINDGAASQSPLAHVSSRGARGAGDDTAPSSCWKPSSTWPMTYAASAAAPPLTTMPRAESQAGCAVRRALAAPNATSVHVVTRHDAPNM